MRLFTHVTVSMEYTIVKFLCHKSLNMIVFLHIEATKLIITKKGPLPSWTKPAKHFLLRFYIRLRLSMIEINSTRYSA